MFPKPAFATFSVLLLFSAHMLAQKAFIPKSAPKTRLDSMMMESNILMFKQSSVSPDTGKATLRVRIFEKGVETEPVQGATVLLRRDQDKMLGRVTKHDGRCMFSAVAATYTVRVQMTGLKSMEKSGITLEAGKVYDLEISMAKN